MKRVYTLTNNIRNLELYQHLGPGDYMLFMDAKGRGSIFVVFGVKECKGIPDGAGYRYTFSAISPSAATGGQARLLLEIEFEKPKKEIRLSFPAKAIPLLLGSCELYVFIDKKPEWLDAGSIIDEDTFLTLAERGGVSFDLKEVRDEILRLGTLVFLFQAAVDSIRLCQEAEKKIRQGG